MVILDVLLLLHVPASSAVDEADDVFISRVAYDSSSCRRRRSGGSTGQRGI